MKIARVFLDVDMRSGFQGLRKLLAANNMDPRTWGTGDFVVFLNRRGSAFKVLAGNDYLVYYNHQKRFPLEAISHLPEFFGGGQFEFSKAVDKTIRQKLRLDL